MQWKRLDGRRNMVDELEDKAASMLESLTQSVVEGPADLLAIYIQLKVQAKNDPEKLKGVDELAKLVISKLPDLTRLVSDSTKILETFLSFRASKKQETATENLLKLNESLVKQNRRLAFATVFLAASTAALVLVTALHL